MSEPDFFCDLNFFNRFLDVSGQNNVFGAIFFLVGRKTSMILNAKGRVSMA